MKIDILLATYNGEKFIREQIESLQRQTFTDWRLLVSDDGSIDKTMEIVAEMATEDPRIKDVSSEEKRYSSTGNFIYLLTRSTADYAMFCDQDDVWLPTKVEHTLNKMKQVEQQESTERPVAIYANSTVVNERLEVTEPSFMRTLSFKPETYTKCKALVSNICQGSTMMLNRALVSRINELSIPDAYPQHDYWAAAIALYEGSLVYLNEQMLLYRQHSGNDVGVQYVLSPMERLRSIVKAAITIDWVQDMKKSENKYLERASAILDSDMRLNPEDAQVLQEIVKSGRGGLISRIETLKKYQMFRESSFYRRCYQAAGILFSCLGA